MISPINFIEKFHRPNLPHLGANLDMDPINLLISVKHVPMEVGTDVSKNVIKKMCLKCVLGPK